MSRIELQAGRVVASHGRHVVVETPQGQCVICHARGKKTQTVVGDRVLWQASMDEGTIEKVLERRNLFYRQDEIRTKSFAANLDQILILLGAEPEFSETQLCRALIAAEAAGIRPLIALNKRDLGAAFERAWVRLLAYARMGYPLLGLQLRGDAPHAAVAPALQEALSGRITLVLGPSGAGKSTLINRLVPAAAAATAEISQALNSGKHTTTSTHWYWVDSAHTTALIDSPGFQEFGLHHIEPAALAACMPDFKPHLGHCRFYNCTHLHEPGCAVMQAVENADATLPISAERHRIYAQLFAELSQPRY